MAFETFRAQAETRRRDGQQRRRRRITYGVSLAVHGALLAVGVVYSFWHVEELSPPRIKVTFLSAAPPPPPPPPPAGGGGAARKKPQVKTKTVATKTPELVQPREVKTEPKPEPEEKPTPEPGEKGEPGGVAGGVAGGTPGGTVGGTLGGKPGGTVGGTLGGTGTAAPAKFLPPHMGAGQKASGDEPPFPALLRRPGVVYRVLAKICVGTDGTVEKVTIMKGADSLLDQGVVSTVKTWRYRPLMANATAVPFCYPATFEFKTQ